MMLIKLLKPIFILILSLCLLIPQIVTYISKAEIVAIGLETTALVTRKHSTRGGSYADVQYTVGNTDYHSTMSVKGNKISVGETVAILYHPEHPGKITLKNRNNANDKLTDLLVVSFPAILLLFGSVISIVLKTIRKRQTSIVKKLALAGCTISFDILSFGIVIDE